MLFVDELIVHIHRAHDIPRDQLEREFKAAAIDAARRILGDSQADEELLLEMGYVFSAEKKPNTAAEQLASLVAAPRRSPELEREIEHAVSEVFFRYEPWPEFAENSLGRLLQDGGGWLVGLRGESDAVTLEILSSWMKLSVAGPQLVMLEYGMKLRLRRGEESSEYDLQPMAEQAGGIRDGLDLPAATDSIPRVEQTLAEIAAELAEKDWDHIGGLNRWPFRILAAAQRAPDDDSLFAWCRDEFLPRLIDEQIEIDLADGKKLIVQWQEIILPDDTMQGLKDGGVQLLTMEAVEGVVESVSQSSINLGYLSGASFTAPAPDPEIRDALLQYADRWRDYTRARLAFHLDQSTHPIDWSYWQFAHVPLWILRLVELAARDGLPGAPPVPPFDNDAVEASAQALQPLSATDREWVEEQFSTATARPIGSYRFDDYLLVLGADTTSLPHALSEIWLKKDGREEIVQILLTDVWNPASKWCIDGDAFAFRRFTQWLRAALCVAAADSTVTFVGEDDPDDPPREVKLTVTDWLLFDEPDEGDEFLIDWRHQNWVVVAGRPVDCAAGMFGFSAEYGQRLREGADAAIWREFLCQVVDPRFDYAQLP